jgi:anti-anti-sigma factor
MTNGRVLIANQEGSYVFKLTGDVRMTLCTTIDNCLQLMIQDPNFQSVVVDVTEAEGIDSTSLGLLAKISRIASVKMKVLPTLVSSNPDITRVIDTMGFRDRVYVIVSDADVDAGNVPLSEADILPVDEHSAQARVLEAHKILMSLNENNKVAFKELVECIEQPNY